ncbi:HXXEE domain-containing protein [Rummeliibacillus pycnus]|uniref:HXXEE domain-containing protein n=1 Tax=Rummeliibacillus pycnus TaxID=101070 RepID=UPI000C9ADD76|nr:HXXEE domain-containing protein [Rummeliibacillus pycnus]
MESIGIFFCLAITLHNLEEAIWLPKWSQNASKFQKSVSPREFHFAVIVITLLGYLSAFMYTYFPENSIAKWIFIGFLGSMILNALVPHFMATIIMKQYAPGLITGILLNIPINSFIIRKMFSNHLIIWSELIISTLIVGICLTLLIPILFKLGRMFSNNDRAILRS